MVAVGLRWVCFDIHYGWVLGMLHNTIAFFMELGKTKKYFKLILRDSSNMITGSRARLMHLQYLAAGLMIKWVSILREDYHGKSVQLF